MKKNEGKNNQEMTLSAAAYEIVDLPDEGRSGVLKIANPKGWSVAHCKLSRVKDHVVDILFSADVKRVGASGELRWQVNSAGYPTVGVIENAEENVWYSIRGEWSGTLIGVKSFYLTTYHSNSASTIYYIDNFHLEAVSKGKREMNLSGYQKNLADMAKYVKDLIPADIPKSYELNPAVKKIAEEENIRNGVLAFRDFLNLLCDGLIADYKLYDKPPKTDDSHLSMAVAFPFLNNVRNVLINIGESGVLSASGDCLILTDFESLTNTISADGGVMTQKLSAPKVIAALRFLSDYGFYFDNLDLDRPKPVWPRGEVVEITYPDNPAMLVGLKAMATAQRELKIKDNDEIFIRCDYRFLENKEPDITEQLKDFVRPLDDKTKDFVLKLHRRYTDAGLTCKLKVFFLNFQFTYWHKSKEIFSFYTSLVSGYRLLIKAKNTGQYPEVIAKFALPLQEKIAKGYGCEKKRFGEPCQKGCHGFSFSLDDSVLVVRDDVEMWIDAEISGLKRK